MDYLNATDEGLDRPNKTVDVTDYSMDGDGLAGLATIRTTLHKAASPGRIQAQLTVAGDESLDNSNVMNYQDEVAPEIPTVQPGEFDAPEREKQSELPENDYVLPQCKSCSSIHRSDQGQRSKRVDNYENYTNLSGLTMSSDYSKGVSKGNDEGVLAELNPADDQMGSNVQSQSKVISENDFHVQEDEFNEPSANDGQVQEEEGDEGEDVTEENVAAAVSLKEREQLVVSGGEASVTEDKDVDRGEEGSPSFGGNCWQRCFRRRKKSSVHQMDD